MVLFVRGFEECEGELTFGCIIEFVLRVKVEFLNKGLFKI